MKFDRTRTKPCLVSSSCDGVEEGADPRCADATFRLAHPDICGTGGGGGDDGDPCTDPTYRATHLNQCGDDPRCVDPQFAAANPALCLNSPRLILKPSTTSCEVGGSVQYTAVLLMNGSETVLDDGDVTFSSGAMGVAVVGLTSGSATALGVGITTIFATYGLLTATAQLEVIPSGSCAVRQNAFALVLDVSKSSNSAFSPAYATRLAFAKSAALAFVNRMDLTKDSAAIITCGVDAQIGAFSHDVASLREQINAVAPSTTHTSMSAALTAANVALEGEAFDPRSRIVVLFSDGENNEGTDPVAIAQQIKDSGSTIIVVGLRAGPVPFRLLDHIATGGFFINALPTNQTDVPTWLNGLKGYICSGNCAPIGGVTVGLGHLNFSDFLQWNVIAGHVDLIGFNEGGVRVYDLIPGNGNYLDLCGSVTGAPDLGTIECKADLTFEFGKQYRLDVMVAGNQREARPAGEVVNIAAYGEDGVLIAERDITITDFQQGFTLYSLTIIPSADAATIVGKVRIRQKSIPAGSTNVFGSLLASVVLSNLTTEEVIIQDNFDYDNAIYIEPTCGYGDGGCDYGCLESPIPVQQPDPNPLPDQETAVPLPQIYTSTKSYTAECGEGETGTSTAEETRTSDISQQDADNKALDAARITATLALECACDFNIDDIISINLHLYDGTPSTMQFKLGPAAIGSTAADIWNQNKTWVDNSLVKVTGCTTPVTLSVVNSFTGTNWSAHPDAMMKTAVSGIESGSPVAMRYAFKNLPVGVYEFYVYAHGSADDANAAISISIGSFYDETSGGHQAYDPIDVVTYGPLSTTNMAGAAISSVWQDGVQFIKMRISVDEGDWVVISSDLGDDGNSRLNGIQVKRVEEISEIGVGASFNFSADNCATTIPAGFPEGVLGATDETWNCFYGSGLRTGAGLQTESQFVFEYGVAFSTEGPSVLSDPLMKVAALNNNPSPFQIRNIPAGTYDLYVYAHGGASGKNTIFDIEVGTFELDGTNPLADGVLISTPQTGGVGWGDGPWTEGGNYVKALAVVVAAGQCIRITCYPQASANWYLNGFQLLRTA